MYKELLEAKKAEIEEKLNKLERKSTPAYDDPNKQLKWFEFSQNNSGGNFDIDDKLCHKLYIQAYNASEAVDKALAMGVYFDGCSMGMDCGCCGDRWYETDEELSLYYGSFGEKELALLEGLFKYETVPTKYENYKNHKDVIFVSIEEYAQYLADAYSLGSKVDGRIFYYDGKVVEITPRKEYKARYDAYLKEKYGVR